MTILECYVLITLFPIILGLSFGCILGILCNIELFNEIKVLQNKMNNFYE